MKTIFDTSAKENSGIQAGFSFFASAIRLVIFLMFCCHPLGVIGQNSINNIGFESGNFQAWSGATGQSCPVYTPITGINPDHHAITSGSDFDNYAPASLPVVATGSLFSARLGNDNNSAEAEILEFTFTVPSDSLVLAIQYATVLENGLHPFNKQSHFRYHVTTQGLPLEGCIEKTVTAGDNNPATLTVGAIEITPWQTRYISLINRSGQEVTIHFETGDCGPGGHFGYAYVDCRIISLSISPQVCQPSGGVTLFAPEGLQGMWQDGSTADSVQIPDPSLYDAYVYFVGSNSECTFPVIYSISNLFPVVHFDVTALCDGVMQYNNFSSSEPGSVYLWQFGDGFTSGLISPEHTYANAGTYDVSLEIIQSNGCRAASSQYVVVTAPPDIEISSSGHCPGISNEIVAISNTAGELTTFQWYTDNIWVSEANPASIPPLSAGLHPVMLITGLSNGCSDTIQTILDIIDDPVCGAAPVPFLPNAFTPNQDGKNETFGLANNELFESAEMNIFNRFGQLVFTGASWDGRYRGKPCPEGTYCYRVMFKTQGKEFVTQGVVYLVR